MTRSALLHALCVLPALFLPTLAVDNDTDPSLNAALKSAATQLDYLNLLGSDSDWVYDFNKNPKYTFTPGGVANANAATFPAATGYDMTLAMLNLGPCAMLPPHFHPRAPNFAVVVQGTVETWMIQENGARTVKTVLTEGMMTIFPEGAVHGMRNLGKHDHIVELSTDFIGGTEIGAPAPPGQPHVIKRASRRLDLTLLHTSPQSTPSPLFPIFPTHNVTAPHPIIRPAYLTSITRLRQRSTRLRPRVR